MAFGGIRLPVFKGINFRNLFKKSQSSNKLLKSQSKPTLCIENENGADQTIPLSTANITSSENDPQDYRSWDNSSLGPFLTPAASPEESESDNDDTNALEVTALKRQRSVRFKDKEPTCSGENLMGADQQQEVYVSMTMPKPPQTTSKKKRSVSCFSSSRDKTTIHYSIVIANNILQNLVVNTNNPTG